MFRACLILAALLALFAQPIHARPVGSVEQPQPSDGPTPWVKFPSTQAKALVDTLYLMGGPGSWDGSFETPDGQPDWHGWTSEDLNTDSINHWHISTYWAENLGGHGPGNHAMNCVDETIPACDPPDTVGGYGPNWFEDLDWTHAVADTNQPVTVRLTGFMNYDLTDVDWDFLEFFVQRGDYQDMLASWTGTGGDVDTLDFITVVSPGEFSGPGRDEVRLIWRVWSDAGYHDLDCRVPGPGHGAARIDDIAVFFDDSLITFDDFEPGSPVNWNQVDFSGVGDFANLRNDLGDLDPCRDNNTWQVNFVDDGVVVPGTGGSPCIEWCYDPGGWIVNNSGGLLVDDQREWFMLNWIISPPLAWLPGTDGAELSFDVYRHERLGPSSDPGMFFEWHVRSTASADPADLESAPWVNRNFVLYGGPDYTRFEEPVSDLMVPGRQWVQISLGINELGWVWGWNGPNGTPAPYFDNVAFKVWAPEGPEILVHDNGLFNDSFPEQGVLDPVDLGRNWCRVDRSGPDILNESVGDSLVAQITPLRLGAVVPGPPNLHWVMDCNPLFDSVRPAAPDAQGLLRGMVDGVQLAAPLDDLWSFDLPDTGWFFPGDRIHYYITAADELGGDLRTAVWPPDTTYVLDFSPGNPYPRATEIRALPSLTQPVAGQLAQPPLLFCDSSGDPQAAAAWTNALAELGLVQNVDYDCVNGFRNNGGFGLAVSASVSNLEGYLTIIYTSGEKHIWTSDHDDFSNDAKLIRDWLTTGEKQALFAGDNFLYGLESSRAGNDGYLLATMLGANYSTYDVSTVNGGFRVLQVSPVAGNGVLPDHLQWQVKADCPDTRRNDAILSGTNSRTSATLDPEGSSAGPYASVLTADDPGLGNRTAVMPFDLEQVTGMTGYPSKSGSTHSPQASLVAYLLAWFDSDFVSPVEDLPGAGPLVVSAHPNPFNPATTIAFDLPRATEVSLDIFDLQGRLVRRLLEESPHGTGSHKQVWDGRDSSGKATASGVYFYRFAAGDDKRVGKLTLLK